MMHTNKAAEVSVLNIPSLMCTPKTAAHSLQSLETQWPVPATYESPVLAIAAASVVMAIELASLRCCFSLQ